MGRNRPQWSSRKRGRYASKSKGPCTACGIVPTGTVVHSKHHKDGDNINDVDENLEWLCTDCHDLRHLEQMPDGSWRYNASARTPRHLVDTLDRREKDFKYVKGGVIRTIPAHPAAPPTTG
jgi:5-methylcytosine-specific restriction endonuclease McrA